MTTTKDPATALVEAFRFRHATKAFDPTRVLSDAEFDTLLEVARLSPTSFGLEPWRLVVVQDPQLRRDLLPGFWGGQGQIPTASHLVVLTVLRGHLLDPRQDGLGHYLKHVKGLADDRIEGLHSRLRGFFDDDAALNTDALRTQWAARQAYIVLGNLMTAAALLGIDSCPMEGFSVDGLEAVLDGRGGYDRTTHAAVCVLALGYRGREAQAKQRRPLGPTVVGWA